MRLFIPMIFSIISNIAWCQHFVLEPGVYFKNNGGDLVLRADLENAGNIITSGSGNYRITGNWTNEGTFAPGSGVLTLDGEEVQSVSGTNGTVFHDLFIENEAGVVASDNIGVNGTLFLAGQNPSSTKGLLDMGLATLHMGPSAINLGTGEVSGIVQRTAFLPGIPYTFGSQFTTLTFDEGGTLPASVAFRIMPGTGPAWRIGAINRTYDIIQNGGSETMVTLQFHYLDSELSGNNEEDLAAWDYHSSTDPVVVEAHGLSGQDASANWTSISNIAVDYLATDFANHLWTLSPTVYAEYEVSRGWRMVSFPGEETYEEVFDGFITQGVPGSTYPMKQPNFLWYDETDSLTDNMSWRSVSAMTEQTTRGRGFYFYVFDSVSGIYNDTLPKKMIAGGNAWIPPEGFSYTSPSHPVTYSPRAIQDAPSGPGDTVYYDTRIIDMGWNLVGNPTQNTLDWDAEGWTKTRIDNSIYIWDPADSEFKVWNGQAGTLHSGLIAPFQAFWVKANDFNPELNFTDDVLTTGGTFLGGGLSTKAVPAGATSGTISLTLKAFNLENHAIISFSEEGITGSDIFDAYRLEPLTETHLDFFTLSSVNDNFPLVINNLPLDSTENFMIPLYTGIIINGEESGGEFILAWSLPDDWPSDWSVVLQDNTTKSVVSMVKYHEYRFTRSTEKSILVGEEGPDSIPLLPDHLVNPVSKTSFLKSSSQVAPFSIIIQKHSGAGDPEYFSLEPAMLPNYPNPFNRNTTLRFSIPSEEDVTISIYDIYGNLVDIATSRHYAQGKHNIVWDCRDLCPGIYLAVMKTGTGCDVTRLVVSARQD